MSTATIQRTPEEIYARTLRRQLPARPQELEIETLRANGEVVRVQGLGWQRGEFALLLCRAGAQLVHVTSGRLHGPAMSPGVQACAWLVHLADSGELDGEALECIWRGLGPRPRRFAR